MNEHREKVEETANPSPCENAGDVLSDPHCYAVRVLNFDFIYDDAISEDIKKDVKWIEKFYFELLDQREIDNHSWELAYKALEESRAEWLRIWIRKNSA